MSNLLKPRVRLKIVKLVEPHIWACVPTHELVKVKDQMSYKQFNFLLSNFIAIGVKQEQ